MANNRWLKFFFFNDTATTEIYTLSLHDALPILDSGVVTYRKNETTVLYTSMLPAPTKDWKSTRLNSSHGYMFYDVFCLETGGCGNQAPIANAGGPYSGAPGVQIQFTGSCSSDPD